MVKELHITNELDQLRLLHEFIEQSAGLFALDPKMCMQLNLALEEAVTNIILYAYPGEKGKDILIRVEKKEESLVVTLVDSGIAFDPTAKEAPDTTLALDERPIGGLGIHLVKQLMTEVKYVREGNKNILIMVKELKDHGGF
ncbi:ATP-binding protein [Parabacteroides sp. OttesenSCG-928-K15]|nr:ATP-binding protein [Parabacteroides sp. OttesenSCG-928-K15]